MNPGKRHEVQGVKAAHAGVLQERLKLVYVHHDLGQSKREAISFMKTCADTDVQQESLCPGSTYENTDVSIEHQKGRRDASIQLLPILGQQESSFCHWNLAKKIRLECKLTVLSIKQDYSKNKKYNTDNSIYRHIPAENQQVLMCFYFLTIISIQTQQNFYQETHKAHC